METAQSNKTSASPSDSSSKIMSAPSDRIYKWDNVKFFLITCVVLGHFSSIILEETHTLDTVFLYTLSFHMPLFIFVSGLFTKSYRNRPFNGNKVVGLLMLCILYKLLLCLVSLNYDEETSVSIFSDISAPWYLFALAAFLCITYALRNIKPGYVLVFSIILSLLAGYDGTIGKYMTLSRIIVFFPYFFAGYMLNPDKIATLFDKLYLKIISVIGLISAFIYLFYHTEDIMYYRGLGTGVTSYKAITILVDNGKTVGMNQRITTYLVAIIMSIFIISIIPKCRIPFISSMGTRTLQIYILHRPILLILQHEHIIRTFKHTFGSQWDIFWLFAGVLMTILLSIKPLEWPFKKIMANKIVDK
jgi:fucose 4-O-acetylase-like acetyltransferase